MTHEFLIAYLREQLVKFPHLKSEIQDLYTCCQYEIEEGGSPTHERGLCYQSVQELVDANKVAEGN